MKSDAEIDELINMHKEGWSLAYSASKLGWKMHEFYKVRKSNPRLFAACKKQQQINFVKSRLDKSYANKELKNKRPPDDESDGRDVVLIRGSI